MTDVSLIHMGVTFDIFNTDDDFGDRRDICPAEMMTEC
jgi:hypothetical protein